MKITAKRAFSLLFVLLLVLPMAAPAFAAGPVARVVGGASYTDLQEALTNVPEGGTVELLDNITIGNDDICIDAAMRTDITLDGKGYTITAGYDGTGGALFVGIAGQHVTLKDLGVVADQAGTVLKVWDGSVTIENCAFLARGVGSFGLSVTSDATAEITSGAFVGGNYAIAPTTGDGSNITLSDSSVAIKTLYDGAAWKNQATFALIGDCTVAPAGYDWEADYVARVVGGDYYTDLRNALLYVPANGTVELLKNIYVGENDIYLDHADVDGVMLDGKGFTITSDYPAGGGGALFMYNSNVTVKNLGVIARKANTVIGVWGGSLTVENCALLARAELGIALENDYTGEASIKSGEFTGPKHAILDTSDDDDQITLAGGAVVTDKLPADAEWKNDATYVLVGACTVVLVETGPSDDPSSFSGFSAAPCMIIEVRDASGNPVKETGFVISRKPGAVVGASFVSGSELKCTDKSGKLGFSGIKGVMYVIAKEGKTAEFEFQANQSITVTLQ